MKFRRLLEDVPLKLFSLGVALLLFSFVTVENATPVDVDYPVEYRLADGMMLTGDAPAAVHVTLQGPWAAFRSFDVGSMEPIVVDLTGQGPGASRHTIAVQNIHAPGGMQPVAVRPSDLDISLDRRVERQVPVHADIPEAPAFGYEVLDVRVAPTRVRVVGPASKMQGLEYISTRTIDISGRENDLSLEVELRPPPPAMRLLDKRATVFVEIAEELSQRVLTNVPVVLLGGPPGASFAPAAVTLHLKGPRRVVEALDGPALRAVVDLTREGAGPLDRVEKVVGLNLDLPDGTQLLAPVPRVVVKMGLTRRTKRRLP